jgi:hypothetical protein
VSCTKELGNSGNNLERPPQWPLLQTFEQLLDGDVKKHEVVLESREARFVNGDTSYTPVKYLSEKKRRWKVDPSRFVHASLFDARSDALDTSRPGYTGWIRKFRSASDT